MKTLRKAYRLCGIQAWPNGMRKQNPTSRKFFRYSDFPYSGNTSAMLDIAR